MEVPKLTNEQQRALRVLARHTDGCAQPALLADGFSVCQFVVLVIEGFATMRRKRVDIGGREKMMIWLQITPIGQSAVAEWKAPLALRGNHGREHVRPMCCRVANL
jgi:hypothetical protein